LYFNSDTLNLTAYHSSSHTSTNKGRDRIILDSWIREAKNTSSEVFD